MKRIPAIITLVVIALAVGGYYAYEKWFTIVKKDVWEVVPESAVLVYESDNLLLSWRNLTETSLWENLSTIPFYENIQNSLEQLDSLKGEKGQLNRLLNSNKFLASMHLTGSAEFDFVFYLDFNSNSGSAVYLELLDWYEKRPGFEIEKRSYKGFDLFEVKNTEKDVTFSCMLYDNYFVGSFTSFLLEDVIRIMAGDVSTSFKSDNASLFPLQKLKKDEGNVYVSLKNLNAVFKTFLSGEDDKELNQQSGFGRSIFLDLAVSDKMLLMNGFSETPGGTGSYFINTFMGQTPGKLKIKRYVPNHTAVLYHFALSDANAWYNSLTQYWDRYVPAQSDSLDGLFRDYEFDPSRFYNWVGDEISLVVLESSDFRNPKQLLFINSIDINDGLNQLNKLTEKISQLKGDTVYYESFSDIEIREIDIQEFPQKLLGPLFDGFNQVYYTVIDEYILFGNDIQSLKASIRDIETEDTWGRSITQNKFLGSTLEEANVSVMFNTSKVWNMMLTRLDEKWRKFAASYSNQMRSFEMGSIQFSALDDNFYTSLAVSHNSIPVKPRKGHQLKGEQVVDFESALITKPYVVRNHVDNSREIILQDSAFNVHLISREGKVLWSDSIGSAIVSDIYQIDFYKNGKLQFLFATESTIHILDRNGNDVEGYPFEVGSIQIDHMTLIDYDNSKRYRFLVADQRGNLYMYDQERKNLKGWRPRALDDRLVLPPFHVRVRGRDCIVAVLENGKVNVLNRRGQMRKGFPFDLNATTSSELFINPGANFSKSEVTVITDDGQLVKFSLEGKLISRKPLQKPDNISKFKLVKEGLGKRPVFVKREQNRVALINLDGKTLFEKDYLTQGPFEVQYYDFGSGNEIFVITDLSSGKTNLYDEQGALVNDGTFENDHRVGVIYSDATKQYRIYSNTGSTFRILSF
ncbi:MAG: hypothetical protein AAFX87_11660 [Bacteroidota bacterium]